MNKDNVQGFAKKVEGAVEGAYGDFTGNTTHQAKGGAKKVLGAAQDAFGRAEDTFHDSVDYVKTHINEQPVQSTVIALAVGFILAKILKL